MTADTPTGPGLRVIGAGLPRTGTRSLKTMLEHLLGGPCHHMSELHARAETDMPNVLRALEGSLDPLLDVLDPWVAAVDWPAAIFWRELSEQYPDAVVVLSHRGSSERWWASADATVWQVMRGISDGTRTEVEPGLHDAMRKRAGFDADLAEAGARKRYDSHFAEVVATVPADRLVIWQPSDGWAPLCDALRVPVPDIPPSHTNTSDEFRQRFDL